MTQRPPPEDVRALLAYAVPYRRVLGLSAALMLLESAAALAVPWLAGQFAGALLSPGRAGTATSTDLILVAMFGLFAVQALVKFASVYLLGTTAERIANDLRVRLYDHLQSLPIAFFQARRHGDTLSLLTRDVHVVSGYLGGTLVSILPMLLTVAGSLLVMFRLQPALALLVLMAVPAFYLILKLLGRRLRPLALQLQDEHASAVAIAEENLGLLPAIKSHTREPLESARFRAQAERIAQLTRRQYRIHSALGPALQLVAATGIILVLWLGSGELSAGRLSAQELVSFLLYAVLLTRPVAGLADVYGQTQATRGALRRLAEVLGHSPEPSPHVGVTLPRASGELVLEHVGFAYPGRAAALQDVCLRIAAGSTVAIVGPNGAGKSTLAHLLTRMHEPASGRILLDGADIATASLASLRGQIGVVPQHVLLQNATIRQNIAYGRHDASDAEIEAAARLARAHDFVVALPEGYDTLVGDKGVRLSGGQQQRVALARALLKDPRILILDEATAMFDPQGEIEFLEESREALKGRTVLLITHRPASLAIADRIVRMEGGRVVDDSARRSEERATR